MQIGLLTSPYWQAGLAALVLATTTKAILVFCRALAQNNRSNGNGHQPLPAGLARLVKDSALREALRVGECCCAVVVSVAAFLFLWDFAALMGSFSGIGSKIALGFVVAGTTAFFEYVSTVRLPRLLALNASPAIWRRIFWVPILIIWICWPVRLLVKVKERGMRFFLKVKPAPAQNDLHAEIDALGDGSGDDLSSGIRQIVGNTLQLRNLHAQDILLPRNQVQVLDLNDPLEKNLELVKTSGHTRFPLCNGELDHCEGIVNVKDVLREMAEGVEINLVDIKRDFATFSPESPVVEVLQKMLQGRLHMALVRDEFGGAVGVLTLEDALEEVVGEIKDEFDGSEEKPVRKRTDGSYLVAGLAQTHEVDDMLGSKCGNDEVSTFGGWITMALGRIPRKGEHFFLGELEIAIEESDGTRVITASVNPVENDKANKKAV